MGSFLGVSDGAIEFFRAFASHKCIDRFFVGFGVAGDDLEVTEGGVHSAQDEEAIEGAFFLFPAEARDHTEAAEVSAFEKVFVRDQDFLIFPAHVGD